MDKREQDRLRTRAAILDAAEDLMREEGYAAVTSRRLAERAGLKSQLVHYHFGTMDELFQAAYRRSDKRFFELALNMVASDNPIQEIWEAAHSTEKGDIVAEYVAAANHRTILRDELVQSWSRFQSFFNIVIGKQFTGRDLVLNDLSPKILQFIIAAVGRSLIEEAGHGYTEGHDDVIAFMDSFIGQITGTHPASKLIKRKKRVAKTSIGPIEPDHQAAAHSGSPSKDHTQPSAALSRTSRARRDKAN